MNTITTTFVSENKNHLFYVSVSLYILLTRVIGFQQKKKKKTRVIGFFFFFFKLITL
jgi:hypothetical protein